MKDSRTSAGRGQCGAWASPRPFKAGRRVAAPVAYRAASPAGESFDGAINPTCAGRLAAAGAEKI